MQVHVQKRSMNHLETYAPIKAFIDLTRVSFPSKVTYHSAISLSAESKLQVPNVKLCPTSKSAQSRLKRHMQADGLKMLGKHLHSEQNQTILCSAI